MCVARPFWALLLLTTAGCAAGEVSAPPTRTQDPSRRADAAVRDGRSYPDTGYRFDLPQRDLLGGWDSWRPRRDSQEIPDGPPTQPDLGVDAPPAVPRLVITEIMINPAAVNDNKGEWFEIYNAGPRVNLKGWTLRDQHSDLHVILADVMVDAGDHAVVGRSSLSSENGGITIDYDAGGTFQLANGGDEVILVDPSGQIMDEVYFDPAGSPAWPVPDGASISLSDPALDNADPDNWCVETDAWSGSAGDRGTPGAPPGC